MSGLMGETARAARDGGVPVQGILPEFLKHLEPPLKAKEKVVITPDLQTRKQLMLSMSDAFVVLPGGLGTLDEYFEVVTSAQLRVFGKADRRGRCRGLLRAAHGADGACGRARASRKPEALKLHHVVTTADDAVMTLNRLLVQPMRV